MAITKNLGVALATLAQLADAGSEINMMSGVAGQRTEKTQNLMAIATNHIHDVGTDNDAVKGNEDRIIYISREFMAPWERVIPTGGNLHHVAALVRLKTEELAAANVVLGAAVGAPAIAAAQAIVDRITLELADVSLDTNKDYSSIFPDWNYETGVKHA